MLGTAHELAADWMFLTNEPRRRYPRRFLLALLAIVAGAIAARVWLTDGATSMAEVKASVMQPDVVTALAERVRRPPFTNMSYYIALNLFNNEDILPQMADQLLLLGEALGRDNVFISVFENGSRDKTKGMLASLRRQLNAVGVRNNIVTSEADWRSFCHEIVDTASREECIAADCEQLRHCPNTVRIPVMAAIRNMALLPLLNASSVLDAAEATRARQQRDTRRTRARAEQRLMGVVQPPVVSAGGSNVVEQRQSPRTADAVGLPPWGGSGRSVVEPPVSGKGWLPPPSPAGGLPPPPPPQAGEVGANDSRTRWLSAPMFSVGGAGGAAPAGGDTQDNDALPGVQAGGAGADNPVSHGRGGGESKRAGPSRPGTRAFSGVAAEDAPPDATVLLELDDAGATRQLAGGPFATRASDGADDGVWSPTARANGAVASPPSLAVPLPEALGHPGEGAHLGLPNPVMVVFLNDIILHASDVIELVSTEDGHYDMACAMDFELFKFYDTWVARDLSGQSFDDWYPFVRETTSQELLRQNKPFRVFSCWNGAVAVPAAAIINDGVLFRSWHVSEERSLHPSADKSEVFDPYSCPASECQLFCKDLMEVGRRHILMNPRVRVTYNHVSALLQKLVMRFINPLILSWSNRIGSPHHALRSSKIATPVGSTLLWTERAFDDSHYEALPMKLSCGLAGEDDR